MMKKILYAAMAAVLCLSLLSACSGGTPVESSAPSDPVESVQPTQGPSETEESAEPTDAPPQGDGADLAAFAQSVLEGHEFPMMNRASADDEVGAVMLDNYYPGLTDLDLAQAEVYLATISFSGGELALVEAKDANDAARVKEIFQARVDSKSVEGPNNYPEEVETWQRSSKLVDHGNYVLLVCHEDCDAIAGEFNALFS